MNTLVEAPLLGSDVEFFLRNTKTGEIVSAEGLVKGTKKEPFRFVPHEPHFATQLDNVLAEGNIPPAHSALLFCHNINKLRRYIDQTMPDNIATVALAAARLDRKYLETDHAKLFGCDPSLDCWTGQQVYPKPLDPYMRSAGFHLHVGYKNPSEKTNVLLARAMDLFLGVTSVLIEPENERRAVGYGQAGNFRHQPHGMEYRTLSSYFAGSRALIMWAFEQTRLAVQLVNSGRAVDLEKLQDEIVSTINGERRAQALRIACQFHLELPGGRV